VSSDLSTAFKETEFNFLLDHQQTQPELSHKDVLRLNAKLYATVGKALNENTKRSSRTVLINGPANLNAMVALTHAKDLPQESFTSMTRLYQE
jgi:malate dehydrogenase